jgi:hypothetical protein
VPLYEFDEHNEAFYFWHKAKYENYLDWPLDLLHIDAHSDISRPRLFKKSIYFPEHSQDDYLQYYKDFARNELEISSFILPAVLTGLVKNVYFIYPKWRKLKPIRKKMNISSAFGEGKVLKYEVDLKKSPDPKAVFKALPDLKHFNYHAYEIERIPKDRKVILDIDLDYFACRDSVSNNLSYELEITPEQFLDKEIFLDNKTLPFSGLDFSFQEKDKRYYCKIAHKKIKEASYLPPKEEIKSEIDTLVTTLQAKKIIAVVITICRSCISGYCPDDYSGFIECELKQKLKVSFDTNIVIQ